MDNRIPRCMSTQHPDNVNSPFFTKNAILGGEDEVQEAYYAFSHLGCDEQMWDCEGKEVDSYVVKKLLTKYKSFFKENLLGKNIRLTLRGPNPAIEKVEAKVLLEVLESIPRSFDAAKLFYGNDITPIFEVVLPMTSSAIELDNIYSYYCDYVVGKEKKILHKGGITVGEWIGKFKPKKINIIPLFEDIDHMLDAHNITKEYLLNKNLEHQRVFLARSDPALNYGLISAVFLNKIALQRLYRLSEEIGVEIYPIVGVGSAPFRGNLRPQNAEHIAEEYPSACTFTIQSAFKYDYPPEEVIMGIKKLQKIKVRRPQEVDEERCLEIIEKYSNEYKKQIIELAPIINKVAKNIPSRRKRKLHIGLFGYSRNVRGISLPRAITFTASLYSLGLPPEILGLNALNNDDFHFISNVYINFEKDLKDAIKYLNPASIFIPNELKIFLRDFPIYSEIDEIHKEITDKIQNIIEKNESDNIEEYILSAANLRKFLG